MMMQENKGLLESFPDIMTIKDLQRALQIGRSKAYELVNTGEIYSFHIGNAVRVPKKCLIDYITGQCYNLSAVDGCSNPFLEVVQ